ncbi:hypothetical protein O181_037443 [Austropuccinia psidii MF-1]|uniref:CAP-Gly domain-containing protein n=1 Tax=Austropuccinia psidii MF-1 TaxID=1389203 RepID=A0A9Q3DBE5_9BASI|nr:hypothetical protein [Austropuccinia psidii MF-1]
MASSSRIKRSIIYQTKLDSLELSSSKASKASIEHWKHDLSNLLKNANKRFADIAWAIRPGGNEELWAHKAIVYARASGQFQLKYLSAPAPSPHSRLPALPSNSSVYLNQTLRSTTPQSTLSQIRPNSPGGASLNSLAGSTRQIALLNGTDPTLFQSILEALYTANGLSEVFAFLFDDPVIGDSPEARIDKLQKDLLYMWRSKLYADCQIVLINQEDLDNPSSSQTLEEVAVFSAHRAILCSRSPYFASVLLDPYADAQNRTFTLASPPFTPASLHFSLGYLYCGTLDFSNRNFDLSTALQIWRSAQYLGLDLLREEVEAKISDMCHNFKDICKACISRIGRVYAFALAPDVASKRLEKAAEPSVVKHFSLIWNQAIGQLHYEAQARLVDLVRMTIDPNTVIDAIRGSKRLKDRLADERSDWSDHLLSMLEPIDETVGLILQQKFPAVVTSKGFLDLLVGFGFSNDILEKALVIMVEKLTQETAAETYQVLAGQVLLREDGLPMDARVIVEDARMGVLKYLKSHWTGVRQLNGFDPLENWALKEISDEIGISIDDLLLSTPIEVPRTKTGLKVTSVSSKSSTLDDQNRSISAASLRASVLSRNACRNPQTPISIKQRPIVKSLISSINSNGRQLSNLQQRNSGISTNLPTSYKTKPNGQNSKSPPLSSNSNGSRPNSKHNDKPSSFQLQRSLVVKPTISSSPSVTTTSSLKSDIVSARTDIDSPSLTASTSKSSHSALSGSKKVFKSSRPNSPTQSICSVNSKASNKVHTPHASKLNRPITRNHQPEIHLTKPLPRSRAITNDSLISTRSTTTSITSTSSANRKVVTRRKPPVVKKIPSNLSLKSKASVTTIGGQRSRLNTGDLPKSSVNVATPKVRTGPTTLKPPVSSNVLSPANRKDRLRTTSATVRPPSSIVSQIHVPLPSLKRPNSVTSIRTAIHSKSSISQTLTPPPSAGLNTPSPSKGKVKLRTPKASPIPPVNQRSTKSNIFSPIPSPPATQTRRSLKINDSVEAATEELLTDPTVSSGNSEAHSHESKSSTVSNSTIRLPIASGASLNQVLQSPTIIPPSFASNRTISAAPLKPPGTTLLIGIPCVVATTERLDDGLIQPTKFRAVVKYLGETYFGPGQWVGVEVAEKEEMPKKEWNDGMVDGVRYFELGQESKESKTRLFRNLSATPSGERSHSSHSSYKNNELEEGKSLNSLRPSFVSKISNRTFTSEEERITRGLFVRPQEVIFVF